MEKRKNNIEKTRKQNPSFSSTLLDAIYNSIDNPTGSEQIRSKKPNSIFFPQPRKIIPPHQKTHPAPHPPPSSSSSNSSSSSSDTDSNSDPTPHLPPIRTAPPVRSDRVRSDESSRKKKERRETARIRLPYSPGSRLASFFGAIFAAKSKVSGDLEASRTFSKSSLSKNTSKGKKRTVRFCPVVAEEEEEEEEDLFELKNFAVIGRFRDELPVYGTTRFGKYGL